MAHRAEEGVAARHNQHADVVAAHMPPSQHAWEAGGYRGQ